MKYFYSALVVIGFFLFLYFIDNQEKGSAFFVAIGVYTAIQGLLKEVEEPFND